MASRKESVKQEEMNERKNSESRPDISPVGALSEVVAGTLIVPGLMHGDSFALVLGGSLALAPIGADFVAQVREARRDKAKKEK